MLKALGKICTKAKIISIVKIECHTHDWAILHAHHVEARVALLAALDERLRDGSLHLVVALLVHLLHERHESLLRVGVLVHLGQLLVLLVLEDGLLLAHVAPVLAHVRLLQEHGHHVRPHLGVRGRRVDQVQQVTRRQHLGHIIRCVTNRQLKRPKKIVLQN